jgi:indole-3-glycerol phosphate synthase
MSENTTEFVKTDTVLDKILTHKVGEIAQRKTARPLDKVRAAADEAEPPSGFMEALCDRATVTLIAELKKASPSKGVFMENFDPVKLASIYDRNGASALSVLTDEQFFQGHLDYLTAVNKAVEIPVLRKDFIIDPYQIYEARAAGADAILLIVMALADEQLADLHQLATELNMSALVEVHDESELERAMKINAPMIGVNNRDLRTFEEDLRTTGRLAKLVPDEVVLVSESGIHTSAEVRKLGHFGVRAVLVGEALMRAENIAAKVNELSCELREVKKH